ncbi:MAG TPA: hypothetical protein VFC56_06755 [Stellaceae bacterium]|nr:hypothetical protein [Stellaceae bacterium]
MKHQRLSPEQAFAAMAMFLDGYHARTGGRGNLGALLGDLEVNKRDGLTVDPAAWTDWLTAVEEVLARDRNKQLVTARR